MVGELMTKEPLNKNTRKLAIWYLLNDAGKPMTAYEIESKRDWDCHVRSLKRVMDEMCDQGLLTYTEWLGRRKYSHVKVTYERMLEIILEVPKRKVKK